MITSVSFQARGKDLDELLLAANKIATSYGSGRPYSLDQQPATLVVEGGVEFYVATVVATIVDET